MTDRILFHIGREFEHFGIAKFFQDNYDCKLFSIIELMEEPKKIFETQKIINFEKIFSFYEEVRNIDKKPDLKYLESIEKKYGINFWQIAYSERLFLKYNKYHNFTHDEILCIFEKECKFFEKVLDETKPDYFILRMTDYQHLRIFYEICKARNIHILLTKRSRFGFRYTITDQNKLQKLTQYLEKPNNKRRTVKELQEYLKGYDPFKHGKEFMTKRIITTRKALGFKSISSLIRFFSNDNDREQYFGKGRTKLKVIRKMIPLIIKTKYREYFINKYFSRKINDEKFIYFPLHDEPEGVIFLTAPYYINQLEAIINIAKSIPIDCKLYVKEHPMMKHRRWREISYYKTIMKLPNVILLHPSVSNHKLIEKSLLVITIAGTAGLEAAFFQKPSISFTDISYSKLPSVFFLKNLEDLPETIRIAMETKVNISDLNEFVNLMDANSFEFNAWVFFDKTHPFSGSLVPNNPITTEMVETWLKKHQKWFNIWGHEHLKKIEQIKKSKAKFD